MCGEKKEDCIKEKINERERERRGGEKRER